MLIKSLQKSTECSWTSGFKRLLDTTIPSLNDTYSCYTALLFVEHLRRYLTSENNFNINNRDSGLKEWDYCWPFANQSIFVTDTDRVVLAVRISTFYCYNISKQGDVVIIGLPLSRCLIFCSIAKWLKLLSKVGQLYFVSIPFMCCLRHLHLFDN